MSSLIAVTPMESELEQQLRREELSRLEEEAVADRWFDEPQEKKGRGKRR